MKRLKRWFINWLLKEYRADVKHIIDLNEQVRVMEIEAIETAMSKLDKRQCMDSSDMGDLIVRYNGQQETIDLLVAHDQQHFAEMEALRVKINHLKSRVGDTAWKSKTTKNIKAIGNDNRSLAVEVRGLQSKRKDALLPGFTTERMASLARLVEGFPNELNRINSQIRKMEQAPTSIATLLETMKRMGDELDCVKQDIQILQTKPEDQKNDERQERGSLVDRY